MEGHRTAAVLIRRVIKPERPVVVFRLLVGVSPKALHDPLGRSKLVRATESLSSLSLVRYMLLVVFCWLCLYMSSFTKS